MVLSSKELRGMPQGDQETNQCSGSVFLADQSLHLVIVILEDVQQHPRGLGLNPPSQHQVADGFSGDGLILLEAGI